MTGDTATIITAIGGSIAAMFAGMWAMFRSLQSNYLNHLEKSEQRTIEMITTKNGHMERIAKEFSTSMREFQGVLSALSEKIDNQSEKIIAHDKEKC